MLDRPQSYIIEAPNLILIEGKDENNFFKCLFPILNINSVQIFSVNGKPNIRKAILPMENTAGFKILKNLIVTRDANDDINAAFQSVCNSLRDGNLDVPSKLGSFTNGIPKVGVYIFPDNIGGGCIEDLCLRSISDDPILQCVDDFFGCMEPIAYPNSNHPHPSKSRINTYLSKLPEGSGISIGVAAQKGCWDFSNPIFDNLKEFLLEGFTI